MASFEFRIFSLNQSIVVKFERALTDFLGFFDQFFHVPNDTLIAGVNAFDACRPVIFIQAQFAQRFWLARCN